MSKACSAKFLTLYMFERVLNTSLNVIQKQSPGVFWLCHVTVIDYFRYPHIPFRTITGSSYITTRKLSISLKLCFVILGKGGAN